MQLGQLGTGEVGHDQQQRIGAHLVGLVDVVNAGDEVLAEDGQSGSLGRGRQVVAAAAEHLLVGEHGQTSRPAVAVGRRHLGRVEANVEIAL